MSQGYYSVGGSGGLSANLFNGFVAPDLMGGMPTPAPGFPAHRTPGVIPGPGSLAGAPVSTVNGIRSSQNAVTDPMPNLPVSIIRTALHDSRCAFLRGVLCFYVNEEGMPMRSARKTKSGLANSKAIITLTDLNRIMFEKRNLPMFERSNDILELIGNPAGFIDSVSPATNVAEQAIYFNNKEDQSASVTFGGKARAEYNIWGIQFYDYPEVTVADRPHVFLWLVLVKMSVGDSRYPKFSQTEVYVSNDGAVIPQPSSSRVPVNTAPVQHALPDRDLSDIPDIAIDSELAAMEDMEAMTERRRFDRKRKLVQHMGRVNKAARRPQSKSTHWAWIPVATHTRMPPPREIYMPDGADWVGHYVYIGQSGKVDGMGTPEHTTNLVFPQGTSYLGNLGAMQQMEVSMV